MIQKSGCGTLSLCPGNSHDLTAEFTDKKSGLRHKLALIVFYFFRQNNTRSLKDNIIGIKEFLVHIMRSRYDRNLLFSGFLYLHRVLIRHCQLLISSCLPDHTQTGSSLSSKSKNQNFFIFYGLAYFFQHVTFPLSCILSLPVQDTSPEGDFLHRNTGKIFRTRGRFLCTVHSARNNGKVRAVFSDLSLAPSSGQ